MHAVLEREIVADVTPLSNAAVLERVQQLDDKHEEAHTRLRKDFLALAERVQDREDMQHAHALRIQMLEQANLTPTDVSRLRFDWRTVAAIVAACIALWGSTYGSTYGMRTDLIEIKSSVTAAVKSQETSQRLQDERYVALKESVQAMQRLVQLQQYDIQRLNETIARLDRARR